MDDKITSASLACTLTPASQRSEIKCFRDEIISHILKRERLENGSLLTFTADPKLLKKIERLVELDKGCCGFLRHQVESVDKIIVWTIKGEGAGVTLAQNFLCEPALVSKSNVRGKGLKTAALLTMCGLVCSAPLVLGALGLGVTGIGLGTLGIEIAALGVVAIIAGAYWYYKKRRSHTGRSHTDKGTKNENRCSC